MQAVNKVVAETTARLLYGNKGRVCVYCARAYKEWAYNDRATKVCSSCEGKLWAFIKDIKTYVGLVYVTPE